MLIDVRKTMYDQNKNFNKQIKKNKKMRKQKFWISRITALKNH